MNCGIVQNYFVNDIGLLGPGDITMFNFSVNAHGNRPEQVIKQFFQDNKSANVIVYYTGHGDKSGSWHFTLYKQGSTGEEVTVSPENLTQWYRNVTAGGFCSLSVISQSCYSGRWCQIAEANADIYTEVLTSASPGQTSVSSKVGSEATRFWFQKGSRPTASKQLWYSWTFTESSSGRFHFSFIGHLKIISLKGLAPLTVYFYPGSNKCALSYGKVNHNTGEQKWGTRTSADDVWNEWDKWYSQGFRLRCLTSNGSMFGFYAEKGFGASQTMFKGGIDYVKPLIDKNWDDGYRITSVCPLSSKGWFVVMTKGGTCDFPPMSESGAGMWRTRSTFSDAMKEVDEFYKKGYIITCLAYNKQSETYFLVMRESSKGQSYQYGGGFPTDWISSKWKDGLAITTIMYDGVRWFVSMTSGVCTKNGWTYDREIAGIDY